MMVTVGGFKVSDAAKLKEAYEKINRADALLSSSEEIRRRMHDLIFGDEEPTTLTVFLDRKGTRYTHETDLLMDDELAGDLLKALSAYERRCEKALSEIELTIG